MYTKSFGSRTGHLRPLTNNDPGNVFPAPFGRPRPLKHVRRGRVMVDPMNVPDDPAIQRNLFRQVHSEYGNHALQQLQDAPSNVQSQGGYGGITTAQQVFVNTTDDASQDRKARRRAMPSNTVLPKRYNSSYAQYLQARCRTHEQQSFHFEPSVGQNMYHAQCYDGRCQYTVYKPNNQAFQQQGGVDASLFTLKRNVDTLR